MGPASASGGVPYFGIEAGRALLLPDGGFLPSSVDGGIDLFLASGPTGATMMQGPSGLGTDHFVDLVPRGATSIALGGMVTGPLTWAGQTVCGTSSHCAVVAEANDAGPQHLWEIGQDTYGFTIASAGASTWFAGLCNSGTIDSTPCANVSYVGQVDSTGISGKLSFGQNAGAQGFRSGTVDGGLRLIGSYSFSFSLSTGTAPTPTSVDLFFASFKTLTTGSINSTFGGAGYDTVVAMAVSPNQQLIAAVVSAGNGTGNFTAGTCSFPLFSNKSRTAVLVLNTQGVCQAVRAFAPDTEVYALAWSGDSKQLVVGGGFVSENFGGDAGLVSAVIPTVTGSYPTDGFVATYTPSLMFLQSVIVSTPDDRDVVEGITFAGGQGWASGETSYRAGALPTERMTVAGQPSIGPIAVPVSTSSANYFLVPLKP